MNAFMFSIAPVVWRYDYVEVDERSSCDMIANGGFSVVQKEHASRLAIFVWPAVFSSNSFWCYLSRTMKSSSWVTFPLRRWRTSNKKPKRQVPNYRT
ncbi:hypothetical protein, partial [Enterobacter asburiae]|uniref:hypothetical protein n=1 Tax=Enterobacter asburiae TaxID=61645 RepID=UPI0021D14F30